MQLFYRLGRIAVCAAALAMLPAMQGRMNNFETRALGMHNRERAIMGTPPLDWDDDLADGAREWANHLSRTGRFEHSPNTPGKHPQGENIWGGTKGAFGVEAMVGLWIAEKAHYRSGVFPANSKTGDVADVGHYTQLIWRKTDKVGCAIGDAGNEEIMVCRYSGPGNIRGQHPLL